MAYPELASRGVSERRKCKWLVRVGASDGDAHPDLKKNHGRGRGGSGQPENYQFDLFYCARRAGATGRKVP